MTKEITKAYILQQLEDKFKLRESIPEKFTFSETVLPVYNIEPHLTTWESLTETVSITAIGGVQFYAVPEKERWLLRSYVVVYGMTGAIKGTGLYMAHRPHPSTTAMYLDMKKGQEVSYLTTLNTPVVLQSITKLMYYIDTYVSTQDLTIRIDIQREEIR